MSLSKRQLGSSGAWITAVGFGFWPIGGWEYGWGPRVDAASPYTMRRAVELGTNSVSARLARCHWSDCRCTLGPARGRLDTRCHSRPDSRRSEREFRKPSFEHALGGANAALEDSPKLRPC
jgi:hypothetical protein